MRDLLAVLLGVTVLAGCGEKEHDPVLVQIVARLEQATEALQLCTDLDSATTARPRLEQLAEEIALLREQAAGLPPLHGGERERQEATWSPILEKEMTRLLEEVTRCERHELLASVLHEELKALREELR